MMSEQGEYLTIHCFSGELMGVTMGIPTYISISGMIVQTDVLLYKIINQQTLHQ